MWLNAREPLPTPFLTPVTRDFASFLHDHYNYGRQKVASSPRAEEMALCRSSALGLLCNRSVNVCRGSVASRVLATLLALAEAVVAFGAVTFCIAPQYHMPTAPGQVSAPHHTKTRPQLRQVIALLPAKQSAVEVTHFAHLQIVQRKFWWSG